MEATLEQAQQLGLLPEEFEAIKKILGRTPNFTETAMYSVMWSEHCSYKNSIKYIKKLPREGSRLLVKAGEENAGLVDIGDGLAIVFKIESHNHPSAFEPFEGASTGVGGVHRDIFTMGARPIASLNSLRVGDINHPQTKFVLKGAVEGIQHYGSNYGVPTVAGETYFEDCYQVNPLVNAMSVGIMKVGEMISATADGVGNPVFIVGNPTNRDGVGGAASASTDLTEEDADKERSIPKGDPFGGRKLRDACLELVGKDIIVGMQDMGAAGITCSTSEMTEKKMVGMDIDLSKVPTTEENMKAWEMLISESQERMLIVCQKGKEQELKDIFNKWEVSCEEIGVVTDNNNRLRYFLNGELMAEVPGESLVLGGGAPVYDRDYKEPAYFEKVKAFQLESIAEPEDLKAIAEKLIQLPNIASKKWIVAYFNDSQEEASDAGLVAIEGTTKAVALTTDCNSRYVYSDPYKGGMIAVAEAARNIVCSGGYPVAISNCLNFGNPYDPEVYYQFVYALKGMGEACIAFDAPVTGGNVSFYNQGPDRAVYPTPVIGMLGVVDDLTATKTTLNFKNEGDVIYMLGQHRNDINSSEYLAKICGVEYSPAPHFELDEEVAMQKALASVIKKNLVNSAHDLSEGGLIVALLESSFHKGLGFHLSEDALSKAASSIRKDAFLFGEAQSRVIVSVSADKAADFEAALNGQPFDKIGIVSDGSIQIGNENWGNISDWKNKYDHVLKDIMS